MLNFFAVVSKGTKGKPMVDSSYIKTISLLFLLAFAAFSEQSPQERFAEAMQQQRRKNFDKAENILTELLGQSPGHPALLYARGLNHYFAGDMTAAINDYTKALTIAPTDGDLLNNRGAAYLADGQLKKALADYNECLKQIPAHPPATMNRGLIHQYLGDNKKAMRDFTKAIELDPTYLKAYHYRAYLSMALKNWKKAVTDLRKADEILPDDYAQIYLHIANRKAGTPHPDLLSVFLEARAYPKNDWIRATGEFLLGKRTERNYLRLAEKLSGSDLPNAQQQAYFFAGIKADLEEKPKNAASHFKQCLKLKTKNSIETYLAEQWMKNLPKATLSSAD